MSGLSNEKEGAGPTAASGVTFGRLWDGYLTGCHRVPLTASYSQQCALRLGRALRRLGMGMTGLAESAAGTTAGPAVGDDGPGAAQAMPSGAAELAEWLGRQIFPGLPGKPEVVTGKGWESKVKGRTGIIFFAGDRSRHRAAAEAEEPGHIDIWNGSRTPYIGLLGTAETFLCFRLGIEGRWCPHYGNIRRSRKILFWEIK